MCSHQRNQTFSHTATTSLMKHYLGQRMTRRAQREESASGSVVRVTKINLSAIVSEAPMFLSQESAKPKTNDEDIADLDSEEAVPQRIMSHERSISMGKSFALKELVPLKIELKQASKPKPEKKQLKPTKR